MVERKDYRTVSEFDSAFNSEIFSDSAFFSSELLASETNDDELEEYGNVHSTAPDFDFAIFSESGRRMKEVQNSAMKEKFPDFSLLEDVEHSELTPLEIWKDDISEFARQLLEGDE